MSRPKKKHAQHVARLLPEGFALEPDGKGHYRVVRPDGQPARGSNGLPLTIAGTPGCSRTLRNDLARWKREGLI